MFCAHVRPAAVFHPPIPHLECCGCGQSFFSEVVLKKLLHPPAGESGDRLECLTTTLTTFLAVWFPKRELPLCIKYIYIYKRKQFLDRELFCSWHNIYLPRFFLCVFLDPTSWDQTTCRLSCFGCSKNFWLNSGTPKRWEHNALFLLGRVSLAVYYFRGPIFFVVKILFMQKTGSG